MEYLTNFGWGAVGGTLVAVLFLMGFSCGWRCRSVVAKHARGATE